MTDQNRVPKGRLARLTKMGRLAAGLATDLAGAATRVATGRDRDAAAVAFHKSAAERLLHVLGSMKGLPMKVGQMLSYIDDFIPPEFRDVYGEALRRLQVKASPMRFADAEGVIKNSLGAPPEKLFRRFDREPIAAASIGQVYRAELEDGTAVAVKVQYPGIAEAIKADLQNIDLLRSALSLILPKVDVERSLGDITARVVEECDYGCELNNQSEFVRHFAGDPEIRIPRVFAAQSSDHVLTTEYIEGRDWRAMLAASDAEARSRYGRILFRFAFTSLYRDGMFNGDPHPGNYVFPADGRVAFLDFGCVQRFADQTVRAFREVRHLAVSGVRGRALRDAMQTGYGLPDGLDEEEWTFIEEYALLCLAPVVAPGRFRFDRAFTEHLYDVTMKGSLIGARKALRKGIRESKQPGFVFLNRIQYGLYSILAELGAEADWRLVLEGV